MTQYATLTTPLIHRREFFIVDSDIINRSYLVLHYPALPDSVEFLIRNRNYVIQRDQYNVFKVTESNIGKYSLAQLGNYVVSWKDEDVSGGQLQEEISHLSGTDLEVRYINFNFEPTSETTPIDDSDYVDWEADETSSSSNQ